MFVFFGLYLISINIHAQTNLNNVSIINSTNTNISSDTLAKKNSGEIKRSGTASDLDSILTPEQQGFTKYTTNGKVIYYKEQGSLKIEYTPK